MAQDSAGPVGAGARDRQIVAFDFDGTLTIRDSFTDFLKWRAGPAGYALGLARLTPAAVDYLIRKDRGRIKAAAAAVFLAGAPRARLEADASRYAAVAGPRLFRPDARAVWEAWRARGAELVIVSASPSLVVAPFAEALGADGLIATGLAYDTEDRATGGFATANCRGAEKVARLQARYGPDIRLRAAYGDTAGDREMLQIAEEAGYRVFSGRP